MAIPREIAAVFAAKTVRSFCYGFLGILLPVYLSQLGVSAAGVGAAVTLTLLGSAALTWAIRRPAENYGSRAPLLGLAGFSAISAILLLSSREPWVVVVAAMIGNVAVSTTETGPFLTIEQVVVTRAVSTSRRTMTLSVYNILGYGAAAIGAVTVGVSAARTLFFVFLAGAAIQCIAYLWLRNGAPLNRGSRAAPLPSAPVIRRMAMLFALDSFAGGFVVQSLVAYFLHARFGLGLDSLGPVFFVTQILTAASLLLAARFAKRFGLLNTMVISHFISNLILLAIAVAPTAWTAVGLLFLRHMLSQMDVPTRQAYLMGIVHDHEREAAASATNLARAITQAVSPALTGWIMQTVALSAPFVLGGTLKMIYDVLIYVTFRDVTMPQEPAREHE